ncbi:HPr family phosphocarrier protein [Patulibacter minatonensis]|uniref:HPr family phosphocarrier protein n=1 Tax=Patulibacter minatonensis TaxID=298163 RepID=UPI00047C06EA|nr:HPr family phosphocarrier protein [Patulibacter minatonensis]
MPQRTIAVGSSVGLHARPASLLVAAAGKAVSGGSAASVTIASGGGEPADARSILSVIALGAGHGDEVTLTAEGDQADAVLDELAAIVASEED